MKQLVLTAVIASTLGHDAYAFTRSECFEKWRTKTEVLEKQFESNLVGCHTYYCGDDICDEARTCKDIVSNILQGGKEENDKQLSLCILEVQGELNTGVMFQTNTKGNNT